MPDIEVTVAGTATMGKVDPEVIIKEADPYAIPFLELVSRQNP